MASRGYSSNISEQPAVPDKRAMKLYNIMFFFMMIGVKKLYQVRMKILWKNWILLRFSILFLFLVLLIGLRSIGTWLIGLILIWKIKLFLICLFPRIFIRLLFIIFLVWLIILLLAVIMRLLGFKFIKSTTFCYIVLFNYFFFGVSASVLS